MWNAELTSLAGGKILALRNIPDVNNDDHEDVFALTVTASNSQISLLNGLTGDVIRSQVLDIMALEAMFIDSPSIRIAVAYPNGVRIYASALTKVADFQTPVAPSHLMTFTGNEILFCYTQRSKGYIDNYSLATGALNWQRVLTTFLAAYSIQDALVLDVSRLLCLYKYYGLLDSSYRALVISDTNSIISDIVDFGTNTANDDLTLSYYSATHFLYSQQTGSSRSLRLSTIKGTTESVSWTASIWNERSNNAFATTDVNKDGVKDVLAVIGGNLAVLNGKNGNIIYDIGEIYSPNIVYIAVVDDLNSDDDDSDNNDTNEVVVRADKLYLLSLESSSYAILFEHESGSNGLSSIEDIDGDDFRDIIAGTGTTVTALIAARPKVIAPIFNLPAGIYNGPQNVTITCATSGATIRYTLDRSTPTSSSTLYAAPLKLGNSVILKARAFMAGMRDSDVASASYAINPLKVSTPTISPVSGSYSIPQSVTISCITNDAVIYYTVNGSEPTFSSTMYVGPFSVSSGTATIKAKAFKAGMADSNTASATYAMIPPPQVATPTFSPLGGTYSSSQNVTISCTTAGATIRYTIDGSEPSPLSSVYSSPMATSGGTISFKAKAFKIGMIDSETASVTYTTSIPAKVATPIFDPPSGTYTSSQSVTLTCSTSGVTIRYTADGSEPSASSTTYTGPFVISASSTIRARAFKEGMTNSDIASSTYTFRMDSASSNSLIGNMLTYALISTTIGISGVVASLYIAKQRKTEI